MIIRSAIAALGLALAPAAPAAGEGAGAGTPPIGPGKVVVHTALGGFILGYDIDQDGREGILSEALTRSDGRHDVAVETFDQKTGRIVKIIRQHADSNDDYVTLGIFGSHVGLTEFEKSKDIYVDHREFWLTDPLDSNRITGTWKPPFHKASDIISGAAYSQGSDQAAFLAFHNDGNDFSSYVFSSDVAADTFGPVIRVDDDQFDWSLSPVIAIDERKNEAVLGGSRGCYGCSTEIARVNLATGEMKEFRGLGLGGINGIAFDSGTRIACTATEDDFSVEFYDLEKGTQRIVVLPGATNQAQSGGAVAVDPIHRLFLVGQEFSSTAPSGSSIQVFDEQGDYVESLDGFSLPASPAAMALNPGQRRGFVIVTPGLTSLQSFSY